VARVAGHGWLVVVCGGGLGFGRFGWWFLGEKKKITKNNNEFFC